jgi:hypothetical protein
MSLCVLEDEEFVLEVLEGWHRVMRVREGVGGCTESVGGCALYAGGSE